MKAIIIIASLCGLNWAWPAGLVNDLGDNPLYNVGLYQGDMAGVDPDDRNSIVDVRKLWPGGVVHYELDASVESIRSYIMEGMEEYHQKTCIRFKPRTPDIQDYFKIFWYQGCSSMVGRIGGEQYMSLGTGCHWKGLVVHELGHALGFHHEQARADRDEYIEIIWNNIMQGMEDQFTKMNAWEANLLGETFDYESIMLYEETAFSKDGQATTIKPKKEGVVIGAVWKKQGLSASDVKRVNRLYQCNGEVRPDPPHVPDYTCDFEADDCGIINQENMGSDFRRRYETIGGRSSTMMVMKNEDTNSIVARLITPHFQLYGRNEACLSFDYFLEGQGVEYLSVTLQSSDTYDVAKLEGPSGGWVTWQRTIKYEEQDPRMFITGVHRGTTGDRFTFALDNFKFTLSPCR